LEGKALRLPPSNGRCAPCLPFSDTRPATKGTYPLGSPKQRFSQTLLLFEGIRRSRAPSMSERAQASGFRKHATFAPASQKLLGFRLRSPLRGTMPAQPSNGFFHPPPFAYTIKKLKREWREKSERKRRHSQILILYDYGKRDAFSLLFFISDCGII